jgi:hypothetical protein
MFVILQSILIQHTQWVQIPSLYGTQTEQRWMQIHNKNKNIAWIAAAHIMQNLGSLGFDRYNISDFNSSHKPHLIMFKKWKLLSKLFLKFSDVYLEFEKTRKNLYFSLKLHRLASLIVKTFT